MILVGRVFGQIAKPVHYYLSLQLWSIGRRFLHCFDHWLLRILKFLLLRSNDSRCFALVGSCASIIAEIRIAGVDLALPIWHLTLLSLCLSIQAWLATWTSFRSKRPCLAILLLLLRCLVLFGFLFLVSIFESWKVHFEKWLLSFLVSQRVDYVVPRLMLQATFRVQKLIFAAGTRLQSRFVRCSARRIQLFVSVETVCVLELLQELHSWQRSWLLATSFLDLSDTHKYFIDLLVDLLIMFCNGLQWLELFRGLVDRLSYKGIVLCKISPRYELSLWRCLSLRYLPRWPGLNIMNELCSWTKLCCRLVRYLTGAVSFCSDVDLSNLSVKMFLAELSLSSVPIYNGLHGLQGSFLVWNLHILLELLPQISLRLHLNNLVNIQLWSVIRRRKKHIWTVSWRMHLFHRLDEWGLYRLSWMVKNVGSWRSHFHLSLIK